MEADPNDPGDLPAGFALPGAYTVEQPIVQGRTRLIYAARSAEGSLVAVHVLDAGLVDGLGEWFTQGATARAATEHPTLPRTLSVGRLDDGRPFEVTELLEGTSMREALDASSEGLDPLAVVHVVNEVAAALDALHGRTPPVVHRTLCPEHMVVLRDTHEVRLLGLHYADRPQFEGVRPGYRSPEELAGVLSLGPRADVFSLATVAYELLTGRAAWPHVPELALDSMRVGVRDRVSVLRPALPTALDAVFERAWSLSPDARHSSAGRFAQALRKAVDPLDLASSLASNVFDDRPTAQVSMLSLRVRNNTLLNAGAAAQAIVPRAVNGAARTTEADAAVTRPIPPRSLRPPVPPGTRPVRDSDPPAPKLALPRPEDLLPPVDPPPPPPAADPVVDFAGRTDVVRGAPEPSLETTQKTALPTPSPSPVFTLPPLDAETPVAVQQPPDEPTPHPISVPVRSAVAPSRPSPAPPVHAPVAEAAPLPEPVKSPPAVHVPEPAIVPPPPAPAPAARLFFDEPTAVIRTPAPAPLPWTRSTTALAGLFVAHALLIVGIAHAIAYALVHRQPVTTQVIPGPSPVCAPCAACVAPVPPVLPTEVSQALAPAPAPLAMRPVRPPLPRPVAARPQLIRSVPDFGRPR